MVEDKKVEESELETAEEQSATDEKPISKVAEDQSAESEKKKSVKDDKDRPETDSKAAESDADSSDAEGDSEEESPVRRSSAKHGRYGVVIGIVHVMATFNNTKVTITDRKGNVIAWRSGGRCGFKGSRKSTAYAATIVAQEAAREATSKGLREVEIRLNGPGAGRESAVRAIHAARIKVTAIQDVTPIPHNGCRPPKRRRV